MKAQSLLSDGDSDHVAFLRAYFFLEHELRNQRPADAFEEGVVDGVVESSVRAVLRQVSSAPFFSSFPRIREADFRAGTRLNLSNSGVAKLFGPRAIFRN